MAKASCWLACIIATALSGVARAQVPACAASERNSVFKLDVGPLTAPAAPNADDDDEPQATPIEGGSAVLLDVWHERGIALFLTAGHVVAELAGAPENGQHPWLVLVDDQGQELLRLPGEVPCKSIKHLQASAGSSGTDPAACTTDPQQDLVVVRAKFKIESALHRQYLGCIPELLLFPFGEQKLLGFGFPYKESGTRKLDSTGAPETFDGDPNSARHRFRGQPLPGMSGGAVFAVSDADKTRRLVGVVRELRVASVLDPASGKTLNDERAGATVFAMGPDRRSFLARKVMLELCQRSDFPVLTQPAFLSEVAQLPCVSPRVAKVLRLIEAAPSQLGLELDSLQQDPKTRLTDFDFLQLEALATEYPKVMSALRITALRELLSFLQAWQEQGQEWRTLLSTARSSGELAQRSRFVPLRRLYLSVFPTTDVVRSLAQNDGQTSRALISHAGHVLAAVQAESQGQGAQLSAATAQLGLDALRAFEEARVLTKSPSLGLDAAASWQDSLVGEAVLAYSLAIKSKLPQRNALLDKALASLTAATGTKYQGFDESKNARALSWVYTLNGQYGDALKAYLRAEQFQPRGDAATLGALIDRADVSKQISSSQARGLRLDLQKGYADAVQSEAIIDPGAPVTFDLQKLPAFRIKPKDVTIPSAPKLWAYYKLPGEPVIQRDDTA